MHTPPQALCPAGQSATQLLIEHVSRAAHARPQLPQLLLSTDVSTHRAPQRVCPSGQRSMHAPIVHVWFAAHATPHAPQLPRSVIVSTHIPPHAERPIGHCIVASAPASTVASGAASRPQLGSVAHGSALSGSASIAASTGGFAPSRPASVAAASRVATGGVEHATSIGITAQDNRESVFMRQGPQAK
jgi:hypothetical protein